MHFQIKNKLGAVLAASLIVMQASPAMAATIISVNPDGSTQTTDSTGVIYSPSTQGAAGGPGVEVEPTEPGSTTGTVSPDGTPTQGQTVIPGAGTGTGTDTGVNTAPPGVDITSPEGTAAGTAAGTGAAYDANGFRPAATIDQSLLAVGDGTATADDILGLRPFIITQLINTEGVLDVYTMKTTVDDDQWNTVGDGFSGMKAHLEEGVGSVYYRVYTEENGWSQWALNDTKTPDLTGQKVTAFQMRVQGYVGNLYDLWYKAQLSDGTELGWTDNGKTSGTIGTGKYITGIQCRFWKKNVQLPLSTEHSFEGAQYEGMVEDVNGTLRYQKADGTAYTGWAYVNNDKYYVQDNVPLTGWQYLDGYKFYFDGTGKLVTDLEPIIGNPQDFTIKVNRARNSFTIYTSDGENGYIVPYKVFLTTLNSSETPLGTYKFYAKYRWKYMHDDSTGRGIYCQFLNRFYNGFLVHSLIYTGAADSNHFDAGTYNYLGAQSSDGCVRLRADQAAWVYENCPNGTQITIYDDLWNIGPLDRPAVEQVIPSSQTYDPTDPAVQ